MTDTAWSASSFLDDAEAMELGMPKDAWPSMTTTRGKLVYQAIDCSQVVGRVYLKWRVIGPA